MEMNLVKKIISRQPIPHKIKIKIKNLGKANTSCYGKEGVYKKMEEAYFAGCWGYVCTVGFIYHGFGSKEPD
jgi:hypothetical protein